MPLHDLKLRKYLTATRTRNIEFAPFLELEHDYRAATDARTLATERAYWAWQEAERDDGISAKREPHAQNSASSFTVVSATPHSGARFSREFHHFSWDPSNTAGLENILDMEQRLIPVLARMETHGVYLDTKQLRAIGDEIMADIRLAETEIYELVGERFNINSAKQVQEILFEKLHIPSGKKIKTWYSVDNEALSFIGQKYEIANIILRYRGLEKLRSTYVDALWKAANPKTHRVHTTYNQLGAATGRLSSESPNLQNIPSGDAYSDRIKGCFRPESDEYVFVVADYSQIELRILANLSGDPMLIDTFQKWEDIHARTAHFIFGDGNISSDQRRIAKGVNFGVIYGITGFGLSKIIHTSPAEANAYIDKFYATYPRVREFFQWLLDGARRNGYVETYFGRRRYVPGVNDANKMIRAATEREAINMPIQGTNADIVKFAMLEIDAFIRENSLRSRMILQVHDELVFEVHRDERDIFVPRVREIMEWVFSWAVKLLVDIHEGSNWSEAKG